MIRGEEPTLHGPARFHVALKRGMPYFACTMLTIHFTKAEGAQNDFVIVDDRAGIYDDAIRRRFAQQTAHRRRGVGSDGTIFIDASATHDFMMSFFNPDGSVGSMCGNGGRCAALFAADRGIAAAEMRFEVLGKSYAASVNGGLVRLAFPPPERLEWQIDLDTAAGPVRGDFVDNGAPHFVVFAETLPEGLRAPLRDIDMHAVGTMLRRHARFAPRGCNVNLLEMDEDGLVHIRTFEKGVEAETEACGTGTVAAGFIAHLRRNLATPISLRTHGGDTLRVHFTPDPAVATDNPAYFARDLVLEGPAVLVFEGDFPMPA